MAQVHVHGNVYGGGNQADVKVNTIVNMSSGQVDGNVYGGGNLGDVGTIDKSDNVNYNYTWTGNSPATPAIPATDDTPATPAADAVIVSGLSTVNITGTTAMVKGNVFGAGKGVATTFWCEKAMVYTTSVSIENGMVGTINDDGTLKENTGNVYGGGELGRVEYDTEVKIGSGTSGTFTPTIYGSVFGAGAGVETHGYSALVRGDCYVTIEGGAKVEHNVYGGGEKATAGRYKIATKANISTVRETHPEIEVGMPYETNSGGKCTVVVRGDAQIGPDTDADVSDEAGHVFGAGKGVGPEIFDDYTYDVGSRPARMAVYDETDFNSDFTTENGNTWAYYTTYGSDYEGPKFVWEYYERDAYLKFLQTLALVTQTEVTIGGNAIVKGSVYGGSESGFVQDDTHVVIGIDNSKTIGTTNKDYGNVFGGGRGLEEFSTAGRVAGDTYVTFNSGTALGSVYGGGELGNVGKFTETDDGRYIFSVGGKCNVSVTGGKVGADNNGDKEKGNVFGAGMGVEDTFKCEKAMAKETSVSVSGGTVNGNVYGGGKVGRVEYNSEVTIGRKSTETTEGSGTGTPIINGSVFGAGRGVATHGYSALVRGNTTVTVEGATGSKVNGSVFGGGEIASVGRYGLDTENKPDILLGGGTCELKVLGSVEVTGSVYGAGQGVDPQTFTSGESRRMTIYNSTDFNNDNTTNNNTTWAYCTTYDDNYEGPKLVWEYYPDKTAYSTYLETLALATHPQVTIDGSAQVKGSVFGGGELGLTKGSVTVTINNGTIGTLDNDDNRVAGTGDVYGGGSLANTNTTHYVGLKKSDDSPDYGEKVVDGKTIKYIKTKEVHPTTIVRLLGGRIYGDAYGGGLGRLASEGVTAVEAVVVGDVLVDLNGTTSVSTDTDGGRSWTDNTGMTNSGTTVSGKGCIVNRVFGCNNLNGTPKKNVTVHVFATQSRHTSKTTVGAKFVKDDKDLTQGEEETNATYISRLKTALAGWIELAEKLEITVESSVEDLSTATVPEGEGAQNTLKTNIKEAIDDLMESISAPAHSEALTALKYDVEAVYGGGNEAAYIPTYNTTTGATDYKTQVIIEGCDYTCIETVYGGGNAAPVPETNVTVKAAYEIGTVFGGGNGKDRKESDGSANPGADVGTYKNGTTDVTYGSGNAITLISGGYIHEAYGGSNTKGTIRGSVTLDASYGGLCDMLVKKMVSAGKNADIMGDAIAVLGCMPGTWVDEYYGGADNANVHGNVELTITSGNFHKVFGGNNKSGIIMGHIKLNIEEIACRAINIDELYLGGNEASYSMYGYSVVKDNNGNPVLDEETGKLTFTPRSANDTSKPVKRFFDGEDYDEYSQTTGDTFTSYDAQPELNIISCTHIGKVFGGGLGETAFMYANPKVNINMIKGAQYSDISVTTDNPQQLGEIENVFGGGNAAPVYGDATVNIATVPTVDVFDLDSEYKVQYDNGAPRMRSVNVIGAYISGNVYGGGQLADVGKTHTAVESGSTVDKFDLYANTFVNICATKGAEITENGQGTGRYNYTNVDFTGSDKSVVIGGDVFGGGMGEANTFRCGKAMVTNNTNVCIGNGTVKGTVYGGGQIGRVEKNAVVWIGIGDGTGTSSATSKPTIKQNVFGAGKGVEQYGYAALLRGNTYVTIEGDAKVERNVYGGGEIASVGKYNIVKPTDLTEEFKKKHPELEIGMPWSLANSGSGYCNVTVRGFAEIGTDGMKMYHKVSEAIPENDQPDDWGHVFGAGRGILPYENKATFACPLHNGAQHPGRMTINSTTGEDEWECYYSYGANEEAKYLTFVETQALATQTNVVIGDADSNPFVKGSVYGGSENGHVQHDTHVAIASGQIGNGDGIDRRYTAAEWSTERPEDFAECHSWDYDKNSGASYDKYAIYKTTVGGKDKYYYDEGRTEANYAEGGAKIAKDGHTYYGNVFGGGSGVIPYAPGKWHRAAGSVGGNTVVDITGGHILTSVYGGNEQTDVGTYTKDSKGALVVPERDGKCTVNMTGGTLGVPRTEAAMKAHPVTCYLFGAGKGDQRIFFNTWTNVISTEVNITGNARIYGSTFGGGEDGHIICNAMTNIGGSVTIGGTTYTATDNLKIGTTGTSYVDGNIFGGGRGFSGDAQTAGTVGGNIDVNISAGNILGSVYGGGRLASVGTQFTAPDDPNYGNFLEDGDDVLYTAADETNGYIPTGKSVGDVKFPGKHGHITVNISGGTIGNGTGKNVTADADGKIVSGNVFGGSMGRLELLNGDINPIWPKMAQVKTTAVNVYGTATVKHNVYGGGELGTVRDDAYVTIGGKKTVDAQNNVSYTQKGGTVNRDVYGGGYGSQDFTTKTLITVKEPKEGVTNPSSSNDYSDNNYLFTPMIFSGCVGKNTYVDVVGGLVRKSVYGGGEMASVGIIDSSVEKKNDATAPVYTDTSGNKYVYKHYHSHQDENNGFALSWPYGFFYMPGFDGDTHVNVIGGRIGVANGDDDINTDNGDIYGGGKGIAGDYKDYVFCANVGSAEVTINYTNSTATPQNYMESVNTECITGAVYGGAENGHVMGDTKLTLNNGLIGHSMYGGGSGKGQFKKTLNKIEGVSNVSDNTPSSTVTAPTQTTTTYEANIYSVTAGKVFGNTEIEMTGGYVVRNVYGGGNLGSVGKGNYAGGPDDYSTTGYGEKLSGNNNLWDGENEFSEAFLNSGKSTVKITGGTVGYIDFTKVSDYTYSGLPYGNVFGGCRGESAPNIGESPRYLYCPTFFSGYVNETEVIIGDDGSSSGPTIWGSVYGGGMDGHVRRDAKVTINSGTIGRTYNGNGSDLNNIEWLLCGNVFGAGSGIGKYQYDFNYDGDYEDEVDYYNPSTEKTSRVKERDYSTSAGSVTRFTTVEIKGGTIHRNVYGGGSLSSVGAPKIPPTRPDDPFHPDDPDHKTDVGKQALNKVTVSGGQIGDDSSYANGNYVYGGRVFGGSRGETSFENSLTDPASFANANHTEVNINADANVKGSVFGGGEAGIVKNHVAVNMNDGTVGYDVYGGGALANTNTSNWNANGYEAVTVSEGASVAGLYTKSGNNYIATAADATADAGTTYYCKGKWAEGMYHVSGTTASTEYKTNVNLKGGTVARNVYGGGLGRLAKDAVPAVEAKVYGDVLVKLNGPEEVTQTTGEGDNPTTTTTTTYGECVVKGTIFGCNNFNGSPQNDVTVHVWKTQGWDNHDVSAGKADATIEKTGTVYELAAVYGGGNLAAYYPDDATARGMAKANVIIDGCNQTSIGSVYGGGNAASVPATEVIVNGTYEIGEVFGGGNGKDTYQIDGKNYQNPGANVGYRSYGYHSTWKDITDTADPDYPGLYLVSEYIDTDGEDKDASTKDKRLANYAYGIGKTHATIYGGTVHAVYGGSNQRGNVRVEARTTLEDALACTFNVGEAYGGGNNAPMDGDAVLEIGCISGMEKAYGGAANADVNGDVVLNITNGTYGRVFGGNDLGGVIRGTITVNIEEIGCRPIIIGQLYGGGNLAAYSVENISKSRSDLNFSNPAAENYYKNYPKVNVKSFTSIGTIFGGGYGNPATLEGNPQVNINVYQGKYCNTFNGTDNIIGDNAIVVGTAVKSEGEGYPIPSHAKGAIGAINSVFGGGNEAKVIGNPTVNIGTEAGDEVYVAVDVKTGESATGYYTRSEYSAATGTAVEGTTYYKKDAETGEYTEQTVTVGTSVAGLYIHEESYTTATGNAVAGTTYYLKTVKAVDIRGDVFGGGNNAEVQGDTNVVIGKESTTTP